MQVGTVVNDNFCYNIESVVLLFTLHCVAIVFKLKRVNDYIRVIRVFLPSLVMAVGAPCTRTGVTLAK